MEDLKQRGNTAFAQGDYLGAVASFSQALNIDPDVIALYSNRSAAYLKLGRVEESLEDAEACISMDAAWPKGQHTSVISITSIGITIITINY
jgi:L1 cell adhesion molecule like protein